MDVTAPASTITSSAATGGAARRRRQIDPTSCRRIHTPSGAAGGGGCQRAATVGRGGLAIATRRLADGTSLGEAGSAVVSVGSSSIATGTASASTDDITDVDSTSIGTGTASSVGDGVIFGSSAPVVIVTDPRCDYRATARDAAIHRHSLRLGAPGGRTEARAPRNFTCASVTL